MHRLELGLDQFIAFLFVLNFVLYDGMEFLPVPIAELIGPAVNRIDIGQSLHGLADARAVYFLSGKPVAIIAELFFMNSKRSFLAKAQSPPSNPKSALFFAIFASWRETGLQQLQIANSSA
ncbi:MAG: hypothetical protein V2A34_04560 [Lentisphaerota bacterium]